MVLSHLPGLFVFSVLSILSSSQWSLSSLLSTFFILSSLSTLILNISLLSTLFHHHHHPPFSIWTTIKPTIVLYLFSWSDPAKTPTFLSFDLIDKNIESQIFWVDSFYCLISPMIRTWVFWVKVKWFKMKLGRGEMGFLGCCKNSSVLGCSGGWCCCASGWIVVGSWSVLSGLKGERSQMEKEKRWEKKIYI